MTIHPCPFCSGLGVTDRGAICTRCNGSGKRDTSTHGLKAGARPAITDEITLAGDESEVDYQQTPEDRARINAASDARERAQMERIRWEAKREGMVLGCLSLGGVVIVAAAIVALVYLFARGVR